MTLLQSIATVTRYFVYFVCFVKMPVPHNDVSIRLPQQSPA